MGSRRGSTWKKKKTPVVQSARADSDAAVDFRAIYSRPGRLFPGRASGAGFIRQARTPGALDGSEDALQGFPQQCSLAGLQRPNKPRETGL